MVGHGVVGHVVVLVGHVVVVVVHVVVLLLGHVVAVGVLLAVHVVVGVLVQVLGGACCRARLQLNIHLQVQLNCC